MTMLSHTDLHRLFDVGQCDGGVRGVAPARLDPDFRVLFRSPHLLVIGNSSLIRYSSFDIRHSPAEPRSNLAL